MARLTIVTDAWHPQINGAVTTLANTVRSLDALGHSVDVIEPGQFETRPCPTYPEIPLARVDAGRLAKRIGAGQPDHVLIAVEGPLGLAARRAMIDLEQPFSTAILTRFHDYLWERFMLPRSWSLRWLSWFHRPARSVLTPSPGMQGLMQQHGLSNVRIWRPGVDTTVFRPTTGPAAALIETLPRPIHLYVGRLAIEKNIPAFLDLALPGSKVVVGDGPMLAPLKARYRSTRFLGYRRAGEIAQLCSASDVMVFPSRTDTFGHVMAEALACGLPVAAFPVPGPLDVIGQAGVGALDTDLSAAIRAALGCDREQCMAYARSRFRWDDSTRVLLDSMLQPSAATTSRCGITQERFPIEQEAPRP
jgi:hypothetical protein